MACGGHPVATIRCWSASLYNTSLRKWIYGELELSSNAISFYPSKAEETHSQSSENQLTVYIDFNDITGVNKASSSLIFSAVTVVTQNGNIHWFSSFQDRNSTFLVIQHFFLAFLHQKPPLSLSSETQKSLTSQGRTKFGSDLLRSVHDSQETLQKAAVKLVHQGQQLEGAASNMQDLHEDLNVVDRIVSGLDSWMGRWKMPPRDKSEELILVKGNDIPDVMDLEALYTKVTSVKIGPQTSGVFRLAKDGITVLDLKQKIIHHFKWSDVSRVRLVSPWEILVTRYLIGQPDLSFGIISMAMPRALSKLQILVPRKIEYMNPPDMNRHQCDKSTILDGHTVESRACGQTSEPLKTSPCGSTDTAELLDQYSLQQRKQKEAQTQIITNAEVSELSETLSNLKSLALDIQVEQDSQMATIDGLTDSVTLANDRLKSNQTKINKLVK